MSHSGSFLVSFCRLLYVVVRVFYVSFASISAPGQSSELSTRSAETKQKNHAFLSNSMRIGVESPKCWLCILTGSRVFDFRNQQDHQVMSSSFGCQLRRALLFSVDEIDAVSWTVLDLPAFHVFTLFFFWSADFCQVSRWSSKHLGRIPDERMNQTGMGNFILDSFKVKVNSNELQCTTPRGCENHWIRISCISWSRRLLKLLQIFTNSWATAWQFSSWLFVNIYSLLLCHSYFFI